MEEIATERIIQERKVKFNYLNNFRTGGRTIPICSMPGQPKKKTELRICSDGSVESRDRKM
jgi:hypothetical protein